MGDKGEVSASRGRAQKKTDHQGPLGKKNSPFRLFTPKKKGMQMCRGKKKKNREKRHVFHQVETSLVKQYMLNEKRGGAHRKRKEKGQAQRVGAGLEKKVVAVRSPKGELEMIRIRGKKGRGEAGGQARV